MMDLSYPSEAPALIKGEKTVPGEEIFPIVDPNGLVIARAPRSHCHGGSMLLHPVVHLHIIDRQSRIFLQRRGAGKKLYPLYWDTAVGGHVSYGEFFTEALYREAREELGFYDFNPILIKNYIWESPREHELVCVYAAVGNFDLHPANYEVKEGRYWTLEEIDAAMGQGILTPNFESEFTGIKDTLLALL